jgi:two-component system sensor histidine kinase KdpD
MKGSLRIYLGAAPGVGKTYAMLNEGRRKRSRGGDVVIGIVETHGRERTAEQIDGLPVIPPRSVEYRGTVLVEMDLDAIIARRPDVVLVDEFAHTNAPGSRNQKRWQDVSELLDAGIDVIATLNIQHLESLNDVITRITGVTQRETVPDAIVRTADQIELVDMSPEALRRRMAHGNVYPAERIDAALGNYFRPGNLGALRELALLWVAGRVEESLSQYLASHGITETWETRERVVVGITGAPGGDRLIRRAARMAGRVGGDLLGVHVTVGDGLAADSGPELDAQRRLALELGGTVHEVVGRSRPEALVHFATAEKATQLVLGASRRSRWYELWHGSFVATVSRLADGIDVHVIAVDPGGDDQDPRVRADGPTLEPRRTIAAWIVAAVGVPALTALMVALDDAFELSTVLLLFLSLVVLVSALGGRLAAVISAVASSMAVNWFLVPPFHRITIAETENAVALVVFVAVAVTVGSLVHAVARRGREAQTARAEAEALARSAASLAADPEPLPGLLDHLRNTFSLDGALIRQVGASAEIPLASSGTTTGQPAVVLPLPSSDAERPDAQLELFGRRPTSDEQRVLHMLADQLAVALETQQLTRDAAQAVALADIDAARTSLLRAVSHDLRTPLASIKAMVSGLREDDVEWGPEQLAEALATIDSETDRLNRLVGNLLDASRLQIGALAVDLQATDLADTVRRACETVGPVADAVAIEVGDDLPLVRTDAALLERVVANLISNSVRHSPMPGTVRVDAQVVGDSVLLRVIDRGPGIPASEHARVLAPFNRLGDQRSDDGAGLGLSIAQGFIDATGASMTLDDTPGGGLTVVLTLPISVPSEPPILRPATIPPPSP